MFNKFLLVSVPIGHRQALFCTTFKRLFSQDIRVIKNVDTACLKRGTGGRSSFNGNVVTVFGANGFVGHQICNQLGKRGCQLIIPHRTDADDCSVKRLKLCGDLGQVLFMPFNLKDITSIRKAIKYSNIVINLIGSNFESSNFNFHEVHVKGAKAIASACKEINVERLIHFSALNVTEKPEKYFLKKLDFLPSKLKGEQAVLDEYPDATIFRPANIYGAFDSFLWPLCTKYRSWSRAIPLYAKGEKTIKQPVYVKDVVQGVIKAMNNHESKGKIYQAVGPEKFYLKDLAIFCSQVLQSNLDREVAVRDIKYDITFLLNYIIYGKLLGAFFFKPNYDVALEYIERESVTDVVDSRHLTLEDLGVELSTFESNVPELIFKYFRYNNLKVYELEDFIPPESLSTRVIKNYGA